MTLSEPAWLLLLAPALIVTWRWRQQDLWARVTRYGLWMLVIAAMTRPHILVGSGSATVVVIADRSASMPEGSETEQTEIIRALQDTMPADRKLAVITFAETATIEQMPSADPFSGFVGEISARGSHLAEAIQLAGSMLGPDQPGRLLVISDGRWTGLDPFVPAATSAALGHPVDAYLLARAEANDLAINVIDAPTAVEPGNGFLITAWIDSPRPQETEYALMRDGQEIAAGRRHLDTGRARLVFRDLLDSQGTAEYRLEVWPVARAAAGDPTEENNQARFLVTARTRRQALLVSEHPDGLLARLLRDDGIELDSAAPGQLELTLKSLDRYSSVILENVQASRLGERSLATLAAWIRSGAGGLLLTGGRHSFATGGYYRSPLDPLLPVSMELRQEHRKLALAMVIALDRSGSMAAPVGRGYSKMDLANLAAAEVVSMLTPMDELGVLAVDSSAHVVADLAPVDHADELRQQLLSISSLGGGVFVFEALSQAAAMLTEAEAGTRHILLLADAADAEEPGAYRALLKHCTAAGISVSVVGLGRRDDVDAGLLADIAKKGGGAVYFTDDAHQLPRIFAQDTFTISRSTFIDGEVSTISTAAMVSLLGRVASDSPPVAGYNLTYARPGSMTGVLSRDQYEAPLVAFWHVGTSRVAGITFDIESELHGELARWPHAGELLAGAVRWTMGAALELPPSMMLTQSLDRGTLELKLHIDPSSASDLPGEPVIAAVAQEEAGSDARVEMHEMRWREADSLELSLHLENEQPLMVTAQIGERYRTTLPPLRAPYSPEHAPAALGSGRARLERLARSGSGTLRLSPESMWEATSSRPRTLALAPWLYLAAILMLLAEVAQRRAGLLELSVMAALDQLRGLVARLASRLSERKPRSSHQAPSLRAHPLEAEPPGQPSAGRGSSQGQDLDRASNAAGSHGSSSDSVHIGGGPADQQSGPRPGLLDAISTIRRRRDASDS